LINNLLNKKVEAVVLEQPVAEAYVQQSDNVALAPVKFEQGEKVTAIAMSKNTPELKKHVNESIKTINDKDLLKGYQKEANELMFQDEQSFLQKNGAK
jgi:polar amino acid transport system substrate-binding protein